MLFLHGIFNGIWLMEHSYANNFLPLVVSYITQPNNNIVVQNSGEKGRSGALTMLAFSKQKVETKSYDVSELYSPIDFINNAPKDSVILINITSAITKYDQACGPYGMTTYSNMLKAAYTNDNVKGVALKIYSGGGDGNAMNLLMQTISERNKPVIAFIDDFSASAAYGIASACDVVTANSNTARVGSIGCYLTIADYTEYFKKQGIDVKEIYAPQSKDKNKDYFDAISGDTKALEAVAETYCEDFISKVEQNRGDKLKQGREVWGTGKVFFADKAQEIGLIDNIDTFDNFLNYFNT